MPRQIKLQTREMGDLHLMLVRSKGGEWEPEWAPLKGTPYAEHFSKVSKETMDHALHGWTSPLTKGLSYAPNLILHRISPNARQCALWGDCVFYRKSDCVPKSPKLPNCFQPEGHPAELGYEVVRLWRESVYIVIVEEP